MFDGVENVKSFDCEYSFQEHRESNVFICLLDRWVDISSLVLSSRVHLVLRQSLPLSLKFCRRSEPELSVADGSASIWPRSSEWVFSLQAFRRQFPGRAMEINHWLKHQIKRRTISHCMCVNMHLCVFVKSVCICSCRPTCKCQYVCICRCVMAYHRSYQANTSVGPWTRLSASPW